MPGSFIITEGAGPIVATAIHTGNALRSACASAIALDAADRLREEDPFTDRIARVAPTHILAAQSRFEVDLNRMRDKAVYVTPDDAWGLHVWREPPTQALIADSLAVYDEFYAALEQVLRAKEKAYGRFVVLDVHSYNHRRGDDRAPALAQDNPEINLGTKSADRARWGNVIDRFRHDLELAGPFDVRENVKFGGGAMAQWVHATFPTTGLALALEFKKTFMDEWTGVPDDAHLEQLARGVAVTLPGLEEELAR